MIVVLNEDNRLELTDKAMMVKDFRELYNYYAGKLDNHNRAMAAFGVLYYMYYFDSHFLLDYPDESDRLKAVKAFVYLGGDISSTKVFKKACITYQDLMDQEQSANYVVMKRNVRKLREFAQAMVLIKEDEPADGEDRESVSTTVKVRLKEFLETNSALPKQEEELRKFKERLQKHFNSQVDIYGGGTIGAYE